MDVNDRVIYLLIRLVWLLRCFGRQSNACMNALGKLNKYDSTRGINDTHQG